MITELVIERTVALSGVGALTVPVTEHVDNTLALDDSPFQITNIDGLGFIKADLTSTGRTNTPGEMLTGKSVGKRNIIIDFRLNPNWATQSIADLRRTLYKYFRPTDKVELTFNSDEAPLQVHIFGTVESMDPEMFTQEPSIQVSILCHEPNFKALAPIIHSGTAPDAFLILDLDNPGTEPVGFKMIYTPVTGQDIVGDISLSDPNNPYPAGEVISFDGIDTFTGDLIHISTVYGDRYARIVDPVTSDIVDSLLPFMLTEESTWPQIAPGESQLQSHTAELGMGYHLSYYPEYGAL